MNEGLRFGGVRGVWKRSSRSSQETHSFFAPFSHFPYFFFVSFFAPDALSHLLLLPNHVAVITVVDPMVVVVEDMEAVQVVTVVAAVAAEVDTEAHHTEAAVRLTEEEVPPLTEAAGDLPMEEEEDHLTAAEAEVEVSVTPISALGWDTLTSPKRN